MSYAAEDSFFGSAKARATFVMNAEETLLTAFSTLMESGAYTRMTAHVDKILREKVFDAGDLFCFSGYHHTGMLLSEASQKLHRGPREHLFIALQGEDGLGHIRSFLISPTDIVSDTLIRIDAVQTDRRRLFNRLPNLFSAVAEYAPSDEELAREIDRTIQIPKGYTYEGCHFGLKSKTLASFDSRSRFIDGESNVTFPIVNDERITRWTDTFGKSTKTDHFVCYNVGLRLRKNDKRMHMHVAIRILSFAVYDRSVAWIQPRLARLPRLGATFHSASKYTVFVFWLYAFRRQRLMLSGCAAAFYVNETETLETLDACLNKGDCMQAILRRMDRDSLTTVQRRRVTDAFKDMDKNQTATFYKGMRRTTDALMASWVLEQEKVYRVNFISPETIEDFVYS